VKELIHKNGVIDMRINLMLSLSLVLIMATTVCANECSVADYDALVVEGKSAASGREWGRSVELYSRMLGDCRSLISDADVAKAYDALSVGQLMQEQFSAAIDSAGKCLEADSRYNACMMTAAKAYESLGDKEKAEEYARAAMAVEPYDDYSAAVGIYARDFLKRLAKP
jgi:tetratricopeptide (TPR) repeat protein